MKTSFLIIFLCFLPLSAFALLLETNSTNYLNYYEIWDAGREINSSDYYDLQSSVAPMANRNLSSIQHTMYQGIYFNIYRDLLPPEPVKVMSAGSNTIGAIALNWNAVLDLENKVSGYRIYRTYYYGPLPYTLLIVNAQDNTGNAYLDLDGLLSGIQYEYEIRPVDVALNEQMSGNKRKTVTIPPQPHSITDLTAVSLPGGDISLRWSAVAGRDYYTIYRSITFGAKGNVISLAGDITEPNFLDVKTNLLGGQRYYYVVQAVVSGIEEIRGNNQASAISDQGGPNVPIIYSDTHPVPGQTYDNSAPKFYWVHSVDPGQSQSVAGYFIKLAASANQGTPVSGAGWEFITGNEKAYQNIPNGTWYFHCLAQDEASNLGAEAVYMIQIQTRGLIQGIVYESGTNKTLAGIVVEAWQDGKKLGETRTSPQGAYQLANLVYGVYQLRFIRFGYWPQESGLVHLSLESSPLIVNMAFKSQAVIAPNQTAAYPNPCSGSEIRFIYYCPEPSDITIEIYNILGDSVGKIKEHKPVGYQYSVWPLKSVARGVYLFQVRIQLASGQRKVLEVKKFSVIK